MWMVFAPTFVSVKSEGSSLAEGGERAIDLESAGLLEFRAQPRRAVAPLGRGLHCAGVASDGFA